MTQWMTQEYHLTYILFLKSEMFTQFKFGQTDSDARGLPQMKKQMLKVSLRYHFFDTVVYIYVLPTRLLINQMVTRAAERW